jgi:hypothetical protein
MSEARRAYRPSPNARGASLSYPFSPGDQRRVHPSRDRATQCPPLDARSSMGRLTRFAMANDGRSRSMQMQSSREHSTRRSTVSQTLCSNANAALEMSPGRTFASALTCIIFAATVSNEASKRLCTARDPVWTFTERLSDAFRARPKLPVPPRYRPHILPISSLPSSCPPWTIISVGLPLIDQGYSSCGVHSVRMPLRPLIIPSTGIGRLSDLSAMPGCASGGGCR